MIKSLVLGTAVLLAVGMMSKEQLANLQKSKRIDINKITYTSQTLDIKADTVVNGINNYSQLIIVSANGSKATVTMHAMNIHGEWEEILSTTGHVGEQGVGEAREGHSKTPRGIFDLSLAFGINDNPGTSLPYTKVDDSHYWVDDVQSKYYNQFVSTKVIQPDWSSAEHLIDSKKAYGYCIAIDYNVECIKGLGSAFFLHCPIGKPTQGCIAIPKEDMIFILKHINRNCAIVIDTEENLL